MTEFSMISAAESGATHAEFARAGTISVSEAGDAWVQWANHSHEDGEAFIQAYDAAGGPR